MSSAVRGKTSQVAQKITRFLEVYEAEQHNGLAFGNNIGFVVDLVKRRFFSPDAAYYRREVNREEYGPNEFLKGAPELAVEVRNKNDYGRKAEKIRCEKRADYFAAGTLVVWDVDVLRDKVVRVYRNDNPNCPTVYGPGDEADAEPALPGWKIPVQVLFE